VSGNPSWVVAGREPYRGKWRIYDETMTERAAYDYAGELREQGWRDVKTLPLHALQSAHDETSEPPPTVRRGKTQKFSDDHVGRQAQQVKAEGMSA
jgi:hypothetical protein